MKRTLGKGAHYIDTDMLRQAAAKCGFKGVQIGRILGKGDSWFSHTVSEPNTLKNDEDIQKLAALFDLAFEDVIRDVPSFVPKQQVLEFPREDMPPAGLEDMVSAMEDIKVQLQEIRRLLTENHEIRKELMLIREELTALQKTEAVTDVM